MSVAVGYEMIEEGESKAQKQENIFYFRGIHYSAVNNKKERKTILEDISGSAKSGEVLAILGPSGAGKTSLLNVLTLNAYGTQAQIFGECSLNGNLLTSDLFKEHFCVVPQEDLHRAFLTCRETLRYCANFYMEGSEEEKNSKVQKLLSKLGLEDCADTRVGNAFIQVYCQQLDAHYRPFLCISINYL